MAKVCAGVGVKGQRATFSLHHKKTAEDQRIAPVQQSQVCACGVCSERPPCLCSMLCNAMRLRLTEGVSCRHIVAFYFCTYMTILAYTFVNAAQPSVLRDVVHIPEEEKGRYSGATSPPVVVGKGGGVVPVKSFFCLEQHCA